LTIAKAVLDVHPFMATLRHHLIRAFLAILTLSVFAGDLLADVIPDAVGTAVTQGSHNAPSDQGSCPDQGTCPDCCAVHAGAVVLPNSVLQLQTVSLTVTSFTVSNEHAPSGDPLPIEYPPRLA